MQLYDALTMRVRKLFSDFSPKIYSYDETRAWPENKDFEMIFQKDVAYELGGGNRDSVNLTLVTDNMELFLGGCHSVSGHNLTEEHLHPNCEVCVYGLDLQEIQGDVNYARICEVLVKKTVSQCAESTENSAEADQALKLLQDIDFVKFHVYGKGFMMRTSGQSEREPVRVAKKALQDGITFERMGDAFISHYKKNQNILAVRVSFITADAFEYNELAKEAKKAVEIRNSLSKIQKGLPTECSVCDIREICSEVTGLRELHFGKKERAGKNPADFNIL